MSEKDHLSEGGDLPRSLYEVGEEITGFSLDGSSVEGKIILAPRDTETLQIYYLVKVEGQKDLVRVNEADVEGNIY